MSKRIKDPGFGENYSNRTKRIINKDGSFNIERSGSDGVFQNLYQNLIEMNLWAFIGLLLGTYFILTLSFALIYFSFGEEVMLGYNASLSQEFFLSCWYLSVQTFTTVGYGGLSPLGVGPNIVAAVEAFTGLLSFAFATGLLYGRFSRPRAKMLFSNKALMAPYQDHHGLMFRVVNRKDNVLMNMQARVILMMRGKKEGSRRSYYNLDLEIDHIQFMPLSWTIVHPVSDSSPLNGLSHQDLIDQQAEVLILLSGFDDTFNQDVHARFSYTAEEIEFDAKFDPAFSIDREGEVTMDIHDIHKYHPIKDSTK